MTDKSTTEKRQRIGEIEDRKIEILIEVATINRRYDEQVSRLNSEYKRLHRELFLLQTEIINEKY